MRYHNITKDDMLNGDGLRVVLWLSGCEHHCKGCQNPITWDRTCGVEFDEQAKQEIFDELEKDYCDGITFSGGDPMATYNRYEVFELMKEIKEKYPEKTIWSYTGYVFEDLIEDKAAAEGLYKYVDVLVDGPYVEEVRNIDIPWRGSMNQRVIDIKKTFSTGIVTSHLLEENFSVSENVACTCGC